jgi:hypothetical protein
MNVNTNLTPINAKPFKGIWVRGAPGTGSVNTVPPDHLSDCFNCIFPGQNQIDIREPITQSSTTTGFTTSFSTANVLGGSVLLTLENGNGKFHDETHSTLLAIIIGGGFVYPDDFVAIDIFGRVYITFLYQGRALPNSTIWVYYYSILRGAYIFENACTATTATNLIVGTSLAQVNPGVVTAGFHQVNVVYLSERGYYSNPGAVGVINSTGVNDIEVAFTATVPGDVQYIVLTMTPANLLTSYFVPLGVFNAVAGLHTYNLVINNADSALITSADYLYNLQGTPPGGSTLIFYKGRMCIVGQTIAPDDLFTSDFGIPEQFNPVTNVVHFPADYGINNCNGAMNIRDILYITKPNGTYATQDNGSTPSTWPVTIIDSGIGAYSTGISLFASSMSGQDVLDSAFVANQRGLMLFDGSYGSVPLTYKVEAIWQAILTTYFYKVQVTHDIWKKRIYVALPLIITNIPIMYVAVAYNGIILMGDYQDGLNAKDIKWSVWSSAAVAGFTKIKMENFTATYTGTPVVIYQLAFCTGAINIVYKIVAAAGLPDAGPNSIIQYITTGPITPDEGQIFTYTMLDFSLQGVGLTSFYSFNRFKKVFTAIGTFNLSLYAYTLNVNATGISNASPAVITTLGPHGLSPGQTVTLSGGTGAWAAINGFYNIASVTAHTFTVAVDSTGFGAYGAQVVAVQHNYPQTSIPSLQKLINIVDESISINIICDQSIPGGIQGRFYWDGLDVYVRKTWNMRPALTQGV